MASLVLIDASAYINKAYYVARGFANDDDAVIRNALSLYKNMILKAAREMHADDLIVVKDVNNRQSANFQLGIDYKKGRKRDSLLHKNFYKFHQIIDTLGIPNYGIDGEEADDVIASIVNSTDYDQTYIFSPDKDFTQLVDDNKQIFIMTPANNGSGGYKKWNNESVCEYFDITTPKEVIEYKAFVGDGSDGYKGVDGIGKGRFSKIVKEYHTIDDIYNMVENDSLYQEAKTNKVLTDSLRKKLIDGKEMAYKCYQLAKLNENLNVDEILREIMLKKEFNNRG